MTNGRGGARPNAGRPPGILNRSTERMIKTVREIIAEDPERYYDILRLLVEDGRSVETKPRDRLLIANFFAERIEGKVAERVEVVSSSESVSDILSTLHRTTQQESAQQATENDDEQQ